MINTRAYSQNAHRDTDRGGQSGKDVQILILFVDLVVGMSFLWHDFLKNNLDNSGPSFQAFPVLSVMAPRLAASRVAIFQLVKFYFVLLISS